MHILNFLNSHWSYTAKFWACWSWLEFCPGEQQDPSEIYACAWCYVIEKNLIENFARWDLEWMRSREALFAALATARTKSFVSFTVSQSHF